ncbi:hypothetical protein Y032_1107g3614 [Ancylostoma ceylanicum]|uniref:Uncharacterized protein n=1 Tax=Ancylostoma ceylanicum TaxID=53326 RepID=A0A016W890_9BILA|nr:hypothetical protein Y032_1107g3614 [Ancylostoma ceylanicum]
MATQAIHPPRWYQRCLGGDQVHRKSLTSAHLHPAPLRCSDEVGYLAHHTNADHFILYLITVIRGLVPFVAASTTTEKFSRFGNSDWFLRLA